MKFSWSSGYLAKQYCYLVVLCVTEDCMKDNTFQTVNIGQPSRFKVKSVSMNQIKSIFCLLNAIMNAPTKFLDCSLVSLALQLAAL
jgi:hypothetical protein